MTSLVGVKLCYLCFCLANDPLMCEMENIVCICIYNATMLTFYIFVHPWKWLLRKGIALKLKILRHSKGTARKSYQLLKNHLLRRKDKQCSYKVGRGSKRFPFTVSEKRDCVDVAGMLTMNKVKWFSMTSSEYTIAT